MKKAQRWISLIAFVCLFAFRAAAADSVTTESVTADPTTAVAVHARGGLPHLRDAARHGAGEFRVAYLGGSITAAGNGWRSLTTEFLQSKHPKLKIVEIDAGLPGTGSDLGACRVGYDVLRHHPDLVFVEFAVNDAKAPADRIQQTMEGIVRQIWRANPATDICFIYTVSAPQIPDLQAGRFPTSAAAMERVAEHYAIPSIHLGVEIAKRVAAGTLDFKGAANSTQSGRVFSLDGVHPTASGHRLYFQTIEQTLPSFVDHAEPRAARLAAPLDPENWEEATLLLMDQVAARTGTWKQVSPDDVNLRGATKALLPPTWRAITPGAAIEFTFTGKRFGLLGIAAPDNGQYRVVVDDQPPVVATFFDAYVTTAFCRQRDWFYPAALADGPHRVRVELTDTVVDKAAIKKKAGKPLDDASAFTGQTLTLCAVMVVNSSKK
ncbi:MAG TPA: SGNH/GDSL hydrolase family protein [Opitutaceae bacterium]|nr:SGNH/GDSL hydrolase family protein [Opitutaceae bacterium]